MKDKPRRCGTTGGYLSHWREATDNGKRLARGFACDRCEKAWTEYYRNASGHEVRVVSECGSTGGYMKHKRGTVPGDGRACGCREAWNRYYRDRRSNQDV